MNRSFKLITIFDIPIEINYTWFIILGLVIFTLAGGYFPATNPELPAPAHWLMAAVAALLLFASLLAHELSHSLVAIRNNLPIRGITLFVFGGVAHLEEEPADPAVEFKMAVAGPAMSFFLSLIFFTLTQALYSLGISDSILSITNYLFIINLVVGVFNLIPGFPLDGGRILRSALWSFTKDLRKATGIASAFGKGFAFFLIAAGLWSLFTGSLISGIWFILIGLFLQEAAETGYRQVMMKKVMTGIHVEDIMTREVVTVPGSLTLARLVEEFFFRFRFATFPVVEDDTLLGLVTFHSVKEIEREKWPQITVREVMLPLSHQMTIRRDAEITVALSKMAGAGLGRLLVIEDSKMVGILSQRDIMRLFEFKSEIGDEE
jgi:Zn-dependent protease